MVFAVIVVLLVVFSAVAYFMLDHNLYQNLDNSLQNRIAELKQSVQYRTERK